MLAKAIHLATELNNPEVEPIHLLFALANQKGSMGYEIINRFKINAKTIEQAIGSLPIVGKVSTEPPKMTDQALLTPLSAANKNILERAMVIAHEHKHSFLGTEHLLMALAESSDILINNIFKINNVSVSDFKKQLNAVLANAAQFPEIGEAAEMAEQIQENLNQIAALEAQTKSAPKKKFNKKSETALDYFAVHLTDNEIQKTIDPVIGRDQEIERVIQILCRRTKNNPLLLGEAGVGKTAIVEGLAKRIVEEKVPEFLLGKKIYNLDMGLLIAGTIYRGEFEARLRQVVEEVSGNQNIILFIDEVHNIVGAGSNSGSMDAANLLKPALARGKIHCIGATTPSEFKKHIESDSALERRFQTVMVKEPSVADTALILKGIAKNYELYHQIKIEDSAIEAAARLSDRYVSGKHLPDKAIDLLDETAAAKRLTIKTPAHVSALFKLRQKLEQLTLAKEAAALADKFAEAVELKKQEEATNLEIKKLINEQSNRPQEMLGKIDDKDVVRQIAKIINTKPSELILEETDRQATLETELKNYVIGQDEVINEVASLVRQAQLGLSRSDRPLASFLFVGESGVGKTELAKTLAKVLYRDQDALIKLDMSEFNEAFSVSKLLGSPAGYVGYKESNQFTDKLKLHPYSVVLFDEIDKAHKDVVRLLLQILENGEIMDATGKLISLRHAIIILTTSLGAKEIKTGNIGFGNHSDKTEDTKKLLTEKLKEYFSPEVINRLDQICLFNSLDKIALTKIAELELKGLNERLAQYHTELSSNEKTLGWIVASLPKEQIGAREIRRAVRKDIEKLMAEIVIKRVLKPNYQLTISNHKLTVK